MSNNNSNERKMIRVQSVLILCERCPAIKGDRTLGFANKDVISPLPKDERIPDPVAIIAKNLSKERKHYLQKVRARGMPERFSVSLAKPRDWRRTVKVRAPKRRRLKVEDQMKQQQARVEHSLEQRQRQRQRQGLERTGGGGTTTTTTAKTKKKKKKKNDDDDDSDDDNKNSNENETATMTTKTRRKREEEGEDDTAKVTSPLIKRATKRGKIPVNFMRKKKGPSGNNAESDIDNNGGGSNNNTEEQSNNNVDGNNAKDDNTFSLNKNSNVSSETVVVESPFNKQKAGANSNGTNNKKDAAKTTTTTAMVVEGDEAAAVAEALQRQQEQEQEQNKNTKNPDVGRIKITVTITQKARRSQANSIRIPPTIVAVDKNATAYDLINALVITAPMHFDNGQQPTLHWDFHHVPDFSTIHGFAVGSWKVDVFEEDLTDMATLELRASPGTMIRSPALCKNAPEGFRPWLAPENLRVELDGSRDRGFAERDAITTFDRHFMKIQNYPNGSNNMHNMIGHGASDTAAGAGSGDGENNLESNTNTNNNNNNTSNNNNNNNKKRIMKNARYYEGFIQHVNENDHNMTSQVLHPGRTSSGPMIKLLLETKSMPHAEGAGCSIVDVGSACGNFARGIKDAFPFSSVCGIEIQKELVESSRADHGHKVTFIAGAAESELHRCVNATHILATTKNFETKTIDHIVNVAASLPLLTHLVINESRLCTTMCKVRIKSCCVFEPIETRSISTHWGNSGLDFTVYRRRTRWTENPYGHVPRGEDTARAFAERALCNDKRIHSNHR